MKRHAAHGSALRQTAVFSRQRQFQFPGDEDGVLKEHLVKVAQPEKEDCVLVLFLDAQILLHHWRDRHRPSPAFVWKYPQCVAPQEPPQVEQLPEQSPSSGTWPVTMNCST